MLVVPPSVVSEVSITPTSGDAGGKGTSSTVRHEANREPELVRG
jgi:hypothetical protein